MKEIQMETGWDARQGYTYIMCELARNVTRSDFRNPNVWFENLNDFYDWVYPILEKTKDYENKLVDIKKLLYAKDSGPEKKQKAYNKMRTLFRSIQKELWKANMYVPTKEKEDLGKAIINGIR